LVLYGLSLAAMFGVGGWWLTNSSFQWQVENWWLLLLGQALLLVAVIAASQTWRWAVLVGSESLISSREALFHSCINLVGKYVPGKIWGFAARHKTLVDTGVAHPEGLRAVALEQAVVVGAAGILSIPALLSFGVTVPDGAVLMLGTLAVAALIAGLRRAWPRMRLFEHGRLMRPQLGRLLGYAIAQWSLSAAGMICVVLSMGLGLNWEQAAVIGSAVPAAVVAGMAAFFAPAGVGVREGILVLLCSPVIGPGPSLAAALTLRLLATVRDAICGVALPILCRMPRAA
jgi:hypothetical protein